MSNNKGREKWTVKEIVKVAAPQKQKQIFTII